MKAVAVFNRQRKPVAVIDGTDIAHELVRFSTSTGHVHVVRVPLSAEADEVEVYVVPDNWSPDPLILSDLFPKEVS